MSKQDLSASQKKSGLGTSLVQSLAKQLDARVDTESSSRGPAVTIAHATFKTKRLDEMVRWSEWNAHGCPPSVQCRPIADVPAAVTYVRYSGQGRYRPHVLYNLVLTFSHRLSSKANSVAL